MRRKEIITAAENIRRTLDESGLRESLEKVGAEKTDGGTVSSLLNSFHSYALAASQFGLIEHKIAKIFGFDGATNPEIWAEIIEGPARSEHFHRIHRGIYQITNYLPRFLELITPTYLASSPDPNKPQTTDEGQLLSVLVGEADEQPSKINRILDTLTSVQMIYEVYDEIEGAGHEPLVLLGCDSGSDKSFDFLGVAKLVEQTKELILALWDRVVFFREQKIEKRIELIAKSLPVIERIAELEEAKHIGKEKAELLRRKIENGAGQFLEAGAMIPEMEAHASHSPRLLMAPSPKLLASGTAAFNDPKLNESTSDSDQSDTNPSSDSTDNLSADEVSKLRTLLSADDANDSNSSGESSQKETEDPETNQDSDPG